MCAARLEETVLINTHGNHRKAYRVWLEADGALFHVGFAYGRIGSTLREGRKTQAPVARVTADAMKAALVREKEGRGYTQKRSATAPTTAASAVAPQATPPPKSRKPRSEGRAPKAEVVVPVNRTGRTVISF